MDRQSMEQIVDDVIKQLRQTDVPAPQIGTIPVAVSARHIHLSSEHVEELFGKGYELTKRRDLSQPGQFASNETVVLAGPKGSLEHVRVLGPSRKLTQAEISSTDAMQIGLRPPLRESGNIKGSAPLTLIGPKGSLSLSEGLIIAQAHIHMSPRDAHNFGVANGEFVTVEVSGERPLTIDKVLIRVSDCYRLEMHIDTDEANAGFIRSGAPGRIVTESNKLLLKENLCKLEVTGPS
ncbi:phosphate propanoyltransferase [Sporosarcina sp. 179-K 3D1 HS]|uniref:phosphate propanoyltransferase n=1 Tax=Sporosarcina sp. 179-K 3D1 HS TaxID=3232169 RepID=UPI0039A18271